MGIDIGNRLKSIRTDRKLAQLELSNMTNLSPSYISDIENNRRIPTIDTLNTISESLGVPIIFLLGDVCCCRDVLVDGSDSFYLFGKCSDCKLINNNCTK